LDKNKPENGIAAYFSLSFKEISIEDSQLSKGQIKKLDGISKNAEKIRVFLIGQIGKNYTHEHQINLEDILQSVYSVLQEVQTSIGGRVILLECDDNERLISLYKKHDFQVLQKQDLVQMYFIFDPKVI